MNLIKKIFNIILEIFFPQTEYQKKIESITAEDLLSNSPKTASPNNKTLAIFSYQNKLIKQTIKSLKFKNNKKLSKIFAQILYEELLEKTSELETFSNFRNPLLIPIPLHKKRLRERGFNQSELILTELIKLDFEKYFKLEKTVLIKIKNTHPQTLTKNRRERLQNVKGSFSVKNKERIRGKNIILFDDVTTTGATLLEAKKVLKKHGAKQIICLALAH